MFLWAYNNNNNNKKSTHFAVYFVWVIAADTCVCVCMCVYCPAMPVCELEKISSSLV